MLLTSKREFKDSHLFCLWMANEFNPFSKFSDWEKKNVAWEVNDVAIGRYDGRVRRVMNGGRGRGM